MPADGVTPSSDSAEGAFNVPLDVEAGQAVYTPRMLSVYDLWVLGISNRFIWRCPTPTILAWYDRHVTDRHLDIGVGTGYFLDHCRFPSGSPTLTLLDLNPNSLAATAARIARYSPETIRHNVFEPFQLNGQTFASVGINYLLHCLPGDIAAKQVVLRNAAEVLQPGGVLFGSTLLTLGVPRGYFARRLMSFYNSKGIFGNADDSLADLQQALSQLFSRVEIKTVGCAALFAAWK